MQEIEIVNLVRDSGLNLSFEEKTTLYSAIVRIRGEPTVGDPLPFPWYPGVLGYSYGGFVIYYTVSAELVTILNAQRIPDISSLLARFQSP